MAPSQDHLANARSYIAIAESEDSKREAYTQAADEIIAWLAEDKSHSMREASRQLGKAQTYAQKLVQWRRTSDPREGHMPFGGSTAQGHRDTNITRKVLRDRPEVVAEALLDVIEQQPERAGEIISAIHPVTDAAHQVIKDKMREGIPEGTSGELGDPQMNLVGEIVQHLAKARGQLRKALRLLEDVEPSDYARETMDVLGRDMVAFAEAVHSFAERGTKDWDEAFTELLSSDRGERP